MSAVPRLRILADHLTRELRNKGGPISRSDAEAAVRKIVKGSFSKAQFEGAVALAAARGEIMREFGGTVLVGIHRS